MKANPAARITVDEIKAKHCFQSHGVPVYTPYEPYQGQTMFIDYIVDCLNTGQNALVQSPTGTGKTLSLLCSTLSWLKNRQETQKGKQQIPKRIIYTSRTHAQLKQVVEQLVRSGFEVKLSILASRDHTCLNNDLKQLSGQSKELECRLRITKKNGLYCKYFHHEEYFQKMKNIGEITDLEDLGLKGRTDGFCPFFYERSSKNIANLILMPYNYLFDDHSSAEEMGELLNKSIVIFDEGHNIPNICEQSNQYTITLTILGRALQQLSQLRQLSLNKTTTKIPTKLPTTTTATNQTENIDNTVKSTLQDIQLHASYVTILHSHFQMLEIPNNEQGLLMSGYELTQCLEMGTRNGQFGVMSMNIDRLCATTVCLKSDIMYRPFWAISTWISFLFRLQEIFHKFKPKITPGTAVQTNSSSSLDDCKCQICYHGSDIKLSLICLDPKSGFQKITRMNPHSIILTSGTLSPLNSLPMQLQTEFNKPLACPHILTSSQVNGCILTHGPNGQRLNFSFQNRENKQLYKEVGEIIYHIAETTPNGMIVFVPSYSMVEKLKVELTDNGYMSKIYSKKAVYFQKRNSADFKSTLSLYLNQASKPYPTNHGALLFALSRGKISEGLDFSDEKCRAVVMIGVPYPSTKDLKIKAKMAYLDQKSKTKKSMNGNQWYICETIRCINQCIGRIVRNKRDYGSIYLLDQRFQRKDILKQISSWAQDCLKIITDYEDFKFKVQLFRKHFEQQNRNDEEANFFFESVRGVKLSSTINPVGQQRLGKGSISISSTKATNPLLPSSNQPEKPALSMPVDQKIVMQKFRKDNHDEMSQAKQTLESQQKPTRQQIIFGSKLNKKKAEIITGQCPVCRIERRLIKNTECIHELCEQCWDIWLKKDLRCPICRVRVREKYLITG